MLSGRLGRSSGKHRGRTHMEESTEKTGGAAPNRMTAILLGIIAVLLVAVVAIILTQQGGSRTTAGPATTPTATVGAPGSMGGAMGSGASAPFDPATATKVEAGKTPEEHVKAYFDAVVAGDYATAYKMLPAAKQADYGSESAFAEQLKSYGVTAYTIDDVTEEGGEAKITATASMPGGSFQYLWTFVKEGDTWLVKSRTLPGMGQ
jgi:hypothetical protein